MKSSSLINVLRRTTRARRPTFIWGPPGIGKSDVVEQLAKQEGRELIDVRLNLMDPTEVKGFPVPDMATDTMRWLPPDFFPPMTVKKGGKVVPNDSKGILFLDEFNSAAPATQASAYQLMLNFKIGAYTLPKNWTILAAGNRMGDRGVTSRMPAPLSSRLIHLDLDVDLESWMAWAYKNNVHKDVLAFIRFKPDALHSFAPDKDERTFPAPRTWKFVSDMLHDAESAPISSAEEVDLWRGTVGDGMGPQFVAFRRDTSDKPDYADVLKDPAKCPLPKGLSTKYAVAASLAGSVTVKDFDKIMTYVERLDPEFQVVFVRDTLGRESGITGTKSYSAWCIKNQRLLG